MKLVLMVVLLMFIGACGGGGNTSNTPAPSETPQATNDDNSEDQASDDQTSEEDNLPAIVDIYYDHVFRYEDPAPYVGEYQVYTGYPDTCSTFFGIEMQDTMAIQYVDVSSATPVLEGNPYTYSRIPQEDLGESDSFGYMGTYRSTKCGVGVGSMNDGGKTYDLLAFYCVTDDFTDDCSIGYTKASDYDFSNVTIKNVGGSDAIAAALRLLRPSL